MKIRLNRMVENDVEIKQGGREDGTVRSMPGDQMMEGSTEIRTN